MPEENLPTNENETTEGNDAEVSNSVESGEPEQAKSGSEESSQPSGTDQASKLQQLIAAADRLKSGDWLEEIEDEDESGAAEATETESKESHDAQEDDAPILSDKSSPQKTLAQLIALTHEELNFSEDESEEKAEEEPAAEIETAPALADLTRRLEAVASLTELSESGEELETIEPPALSEDELETVAASVAGAEDVDSVPVPDSEQLEPLAAPVAETEETEPFEVTPLDEPAVAGHQMTLSPQIAELKKTAEFTEVFSDAEKISRVLPPLPVDAAASSEDYTHEEEVPDEPAAPRAPSNDRQGGIEILVTMAEKGEIDPKNIDIIDVTDRFLKAIAAAPKENLRQSGKIIFHASVLLRMKAEALLITKAEELFEFAGDDFVDFDEDGNAIIYDSNNQPVARQITLQDLERALTRQTKTRQIRHRRVTLEQLIEALREAERIEQGRGEKRVKPRIDLEGHADMRDMDDILDLAHDEDIEDVIARIEQLLVNLFDSEDLWSLVSIIQKLGGHGDWVDAFLGCLFLSNAGKITLQQDEFYGPLFIKRGEAA